MRRDGEQMKKNDFALGDGAGILSGLMVTQDTVLNSLKAVKYPGYSRDIVSFGLVKEISITNGVVRISMQLTSSNPEAAQQIKAEAERVLNQLEGVKGAQVEMSLPAGAAGPQNPFANQSKVAGVQRVIAVASGKGGVGKSTARRTWPARCGIWAERWGCWIATSTVQASR